MRLKAQILKDYGLSPPPTALIETQTKVHYDWDSFLISIRANQLAASLGTNKVYELAIIVHGVTCKCCDKITKESNTCPTAQERLERKHRPGRPRLRR